MRKLGIIGALAGMLGRIPAQLRENMQLMKLGAVKVLSEAEAKGAAADPHAEARALKKARKLNRATRRRLVSTASREGRKKQKDETVVSFRRRRYGWHIPKALKACGHNVRVRGH